MTILELQAKRDALVAQMNAPKELRFQGRGVVNRDASDIQKAIELIDREISAAQIAAGGSTTARRPRLVQVTTSDGY